MYIRRPIVINVDSCKNSYSFYFILFLRSAKIKRNRMGADGQGVKQNSRQPTRLSWMQMSRRKEGVESTLVFIVDYVLLLSSSLIQCEIRRRRRGSVVSFSLFLVGGGVRCRIAVSYLYWQGVDFQTLSSVVAISISINTVIASKSCKSFFLLNLKSKNKFPLES